MGRRNPKDLVQVRLAAHYGQAGLSEELYNLFAICRHSVGRIAFVTAP